MSSPELIGALLKHAWEKFGRFTPENHAEVTAWVMHQAKQGSIREPEHVPGFETVAGVNLETGEIDEPWTEELF